MPFLCYSYAYPPLVHSRAYATHTSIPPYPFPPLRPQALILDVAVIGVPGKPLARTLAIVRPT